MKNLFCRKAAKARPDTRAIALGSGNETDRENALNDRRQADRAIGSSGGELREGSGRMLDAFDELKARSRQLLEAQTLGHIGHWSFRFGDSEFWWSPELFELLSYDPSTFRPSLVAVTSIYSDDSDAERMVDSLSGVLRTGAVQKIDARIRRGDGSVGDFVVTTKTSMDVEGGVVGFFGTIQDISERKSREDDALDRISFRDSVTGLANRARFQQTLAELLVRCEAGSRAAILLFDLDDFKSVNDTLGHVAGDALLEKVACIISTIVEDRHSVARLGGDEFAVLFVDYPDVSAVRSLAEKISAELAKPIFVDAGEINISASVGVALMPSDGRSVTDVMRNVDLALYFAKDSGRGCIRFFETGLRDAALLKVQLTRDLRHAVDYGFGLEVHYQPQVSSTTGRVTGFEALLRWRHPSLGNVPPSDFIPIAEGSHLICDLGLWILREAVAQAREWLNAGEAAREVAVNVSAAQIWNSDFVGQVVRVLEETGLPPGLLCLELTESLFADQTPAEVLKVLTELKRLGVTLALDDFGTGYSSLGYLTKLPFDKLKIDRIFVSGVADSGRGRKLLEGMVALGHGLDMKVVAEGVENPDELDMVREFGCELVQGFFFAHPTTADRAIDFARALDRGAGWPASETTKPEIGGREMSEVA